MSTEKLIERLINYQFGQRRDIVNESDGAQSNSRGWHYIKFIEDSQVSAITFGEATVEAGASSFPLNTTIPAGTSFIMDIDEITLGTGSAKLIEKPSQ